MAPSSRNTLVPAFIVFLVLITGIITWSASLATKKNVPQQNANISDVVCAQDAKLCPDGSSVGRQPPTCAFAACPTAGNSNTTGRPGVSGALNTWKTYTDPRGILSINYPNTWTYTVDVDHVAFVDPQKKYNSEGTEISPISLSVRAQSTQKTAQQIVQERVASLALYGFPVTVKPVVVGGQPGYQSDDYLMRDTVVIVSGKEFHLTTPEFGSAEEDAPVRLVYAQMLSSVMFTSPTP